MLCSVHRASLYNLVNKPTWCTFVYLHMFRAAMCPSSGDITVHLHTRPSSIEKNKYQVSHKTVISPDDGPMAGRNM